MTNSRFLAKKYCVMSLVGKPIRLAYPSMLELEVFVTQEGLGMRVIVIEHYFIDE
jgi:hypothetical protein